jgi:rhamnogalacturonan endolyase
MLGTDTTGIAFNVYRVTGSAAAVKLNSSPITATTDYINTGVDLAQSNSYYVKPVINGVEQAQSALYTLPANAPVRQYLSIPLRDGGAVYSQGNVGDVDGDGKYEIVVKWSKSAGVDPGSHTKGTATVYIDAYKLDGAFLWRIDLGWNLEPGSDYTPVLVYDIDGDGKAEIITKTAEGAKDGTGVTIGDTNGDGKTDYRNSDGRVLSGPEFMSVYRGTDGKELTRTNWIALGAVSDWGDSSGNRACRQQMGIAYLDGVRPSILMCRGVYAYQVVEAWNYRSGSLSRLWSWNNGGKGQSTEWHSSNQCLRMGDVDGDGFDEILKGPLVIDHNGGILWDLGLIKGHGDFLHVGDFNPSRSGLEIFKILEAAQANGVAMLDAKTGSILWGKTTTGDAGRGYCSNIDSRYKGVQCWAGASGNDLYNFDGSVICSGTAPSNGDNWAPIWWDAGLCRCLTNEFTGTDGVHIFRWNNTGCSLTELMKTGSGTRNTQTIADITGDWREELVVGLPNEICVYTTTIPSITRIYTQMHNPLYRINVGQSAQRNFGSSHPDYYLGSGMSTPPMPNITLVGGSAPSCNPTAVIPQIQVNGGTWQNVTAVTVNSGATVVLGPQPTTGGTWMWSGCGTSGSTREQTIYPTSSCTITATYTNDCGAKSTQGFTITVSGTTVTKGDANSNGAIDIVDALLVAQYYVGLNPANFDASAADVNCSGGVDIVDALLVAQYYVGLISSFPC